MPKCNDMDVTQIDLTRIMPHRRPMLLVEKIESISPTGGRVRAANPEDGLFAGKDGFLLPPALIEMVAQAYAACDGAKRFLEGTLPKDGGGFLVNVRDFHFLTPVRAGQEIWVDVTVKDRFLDTRIVEGTVWAGGKKAAEGQVYVFVWENTPPQENK